MMLSATFNYNQPCPCLSGITYQACCHAYHTQQRVADSADTLMRSRYCAFVVGEFDYLINTHHPRYLADLTTEKLSQGNTLWLGLQVLTHQLIDKSHPAFNLTFIDTVQAIVVFKAWYKLDKGVDAIFEESHFVRHEGKWFYTQGVQMEVDLPRRNDPCVCQSGKKFKQCCIS
ncbi:YchJ family protein [Shewanella sp. OMA3-2]|uniref:YchJ family protein n=1 Tax=Shewanella sp. OMA3-2 TaxID=2908650 RepID=UPI001F44D2D9|nr:YchJ family protein [Shewanella sp. OMA3-2]UJF20901.1 YchJ family protein [Shewanella sp. OMA3-2]